ncbi:hypothetical protein KKG31_02145 [Patescibacteria group bacterium]|nr:hypothetical protein [Patescibacteria group bacterium]
MILSLNSDKSTDSPDNNSKVIFSLFVSLPVGSYSSEVILMIFHVIEFMGESLHVVGNQFSIISVISMLLFSGGF